MQLKINNFTLRDKLFGTYSYEEENTEERMDAIEKECNSVVHESLLKALNAFKPHVAVIMGWQPALLKSDAGALDGITIHTIDFGKGNTVAIKFRYTLEKLGYKTTISIPKIDFSLDIDNYPFMEKLKKVTENFYKAVERYHSGEFGDGEQLALQMQEAAPDAELSNAGVNSQGSLESPI